MIPVKYDSDMRPNRDKVRKKIIKIVKKSSLDYYNKKSEPVTEIFNYIFTSGYYLKLIIKTYIKMK